MLRQSQNDSISFDGCCDRYIQALSSFSFYTLSWVRRSFRSTSRFSFFPGHDWKSSLRFLDFPFEARFKITFCLPIFLTTNNLECNFRWHFAAWFWRSEWNRNGKKDEFTIPKLTLKFTEFNSLKNLSIGKKIKSFHTKWRCCVERYVAKALEVCKRQNS